MAEVQSDLVLDVSQALAQVEALGAEIDAVTSGVTLEVDADVAPAQAEIESVEAVPVEVPVEADIAPAEADIQGLDAEPVVVEVEVDTASAEASIGGLNDQLAETGSASESASGGLLEAAGAAGVLGQAQAGASAGALGLTSGLLTSTSAAGTAALGYGALAGALALAVNEYGEAQGVAAITDQILANQGDQAVTTGDHVRELASQVQEYSQFTDESVATGANFILTLGNIRNEVGEGNNVFDRAVTLSADLAQRIGSDVPSAATALGRALTDPERGLSRLERSIGRLNPEVRASIIAFAEQGDTLSAQRELLDAIEGRVGGVAEAYGDTLPGSIARAKNEFGELAESVGGQLAPALTTIINLADPVAGAITAIADSASDLGVTLSDITPLGPLQQLQEGISEGFAPAEVSVNSIRNSVIEAEGAIVDATVAIINAQSEVPPAAEAAADSVEREGTTFAELNAQAEALASNLDALNSAQETVDQGAISIRDSQRDLLQALVELDGQYVAGSESGDAFLSSAQDLASGIRDQTIAVLESGAGADAARLAQAGYIDGLRRTLQQAGLTERQIDELIDTFARVPEDQITKFDTPGAAAAAAAARDIKAKIDAIPNSKHVLITIGSNIGTLAGQLADLNTQINNLPKAQLTEATPVLGPQASVVGSGDTAIVDSSVTNIQVDARGATDPEGVAVAVARALAPHKRATDIKLGMRARVPA